MSSRVAYCFTVFAIILTHSSIVSVKGQCTVEGCENGDPSISIAAEIQQLRVELFDHVNKQVQSIHELLNESFEGMKSQNDAVMTSLQAVDQRRLQEHAIYIKQGQSIHELLNESFQEMKSQHGTVMTSLQAVDQRRLQEHDIYIKQIQSIGEFLNQSVQQKNSLHELLNETFQEMKSQHGAVMTSLQAVDQRSKEHDVCIKQGQSIHELLNETLQQMTSQHGSVMTSLQAVDQRRLQEHDISIKNLSQNAWKLENGTCGSASEVCDCSDIKESGNTASGVYEVCVGYQRDRVCSYAYCDMDTNNSTSLVFQRRKDGSVNFNRTWADYKQGFGNRNGEFWLGNEMLYLLTSKRNYKLRVDLEDFTGAKRYAEYARFSINISDDNYRLTVSGYSGNAGDSLYYNSGKQFSTNDVDNDVYRGKNCAGWLGAGWWYYWCSYAHLNGIYGRNDTVNVEMGFQWYHWYNRWQYALKASEMKLVPLA